MFLTERPRATLGGVARGLELDDLKEARQPLIAFDSPTAQMLDEEKGLWIVPAEVTFPRDISKVGSLPVVAVARGPGGGTSERTYDLTIRDPDCSSARVSIAGVAGADEANEVTVTSPIPGLFLVQVLERHMSDHRDEIPDL